MAIPEPYKAKKILKALLKGPKELSLKQRCSPTDKRYFSRGLYQRYFTEGLVYYNPADNLVRLTDLGRMLAEKPGKGL